MKIIIIPFMLIAFLVLLTSFSSPAKAQDGTHDMCKIAVGNCLAFDPKLDDAKCASPSPADCKAVTKQMRDRCCNNLSTPSPCMCVMAKDKVLKESAVKLLHMCKKPNPKCPK
ncbi:unnamed protein product [Cochlearia groenlandica]